MTRPSLTPLRASAACLGLAALAFLGCGKTETGGITPPPPPTETTTETTAPAAAEEPAAASTVSLPMKTVDAAGLREVIAAQKGKTAVVVNVWATYCAPCVAEFPHFAAMARANKGEVTTVFVSADFQEDLPKAQKFLSDQGVDWQTYLIADPADQAFFPALSPDWTGTMPATLIIARDGSEIAFHDGEMDKETLTKYVAQATQ